MKSNPLISIIVPVYNISGYILKCLKSLSEQSFASIEIIVVDDGSTDGSGSLCDKYATEDERVRVFHKKNGGLSDARNFGIKKARGEMIALIDGDDYVNESFIEVLYEAMMKNGADVAVCGYNKMVPKPQVLSGRDVAKKLLINQDNMEIIACNKLYKRELFEKNKIEYPVGEKYEDTLTTYKILFHAEKVVYVNEALYVYVTRDSSIMGQGDILGRLKMRERAAKEAVNYFEKEDDLRQAAEVAVLTAKYAFMDAALRGKIDKKYYIINSEWVNDNRKKYKNNKMITYKLKIYNTLNWWKLYKLFRTIV